MTKHDDHLPGSEAPAAETATSRPKRRRARAIAGAAGLAAVLGSGAYLTTNRLMAPEASTGAGTVIAAAPATATSSAAATPAESGTDRQVKSADDHEDEPKSPAERVAAARKAAAKDGVKITHPLPAQDDPARIAAAGEAKEVTVGSAKQGATMRIVTAHGDLTGQHELAWVAGGVRKHGAVECSNKFKFYNEAEPKTRDNLLVCWRTSVKRSVITVDTKIGGRPAVARSLSVIDREWRKLG
ncbi:hypothetical protein [Actinoplanes sp. L3-i22]|uniref:hypothetical protein n=1 Tax=Actinoplanes sp. L3-i22 TaxID=2836373 RepID=UPI001C7743DA|nr:hypothetical protein [Actinoplanes sp. L3-i22]BCY13912.1 hypothetical protein L3i22_090000 [Actinoplanes sp. L3-i22]